MNLMLGLPRRRRSRIRARGHAPRRDVVVKLGGDVLARPALGVVAADLARAAVGGPW